MAKLRWQVKTPRRIINLYLVSAAARDVEVVVMALMQSLHPVIQVLFGTSFTWGETGFVARAILPYALAFAAGALVFVVIEEIIPEAQRGGNTDFATFMAMLGSAIMMILDFAFR